MDNIEEREERSVQMCEQTIGREVVQPGWRWSVDLKPTVGTQPRARASRFVRREASPRVAGPLVTGLAQSFKG